MCAPGGVSARRSYFCVIYHDRVPVRKRRCNRKERFKSNRSFFVITILVHRVAAVREPLALPCPASSAYRRRGAEADSHEAASCYPDRSPADYSSVAGSGRSFEPTPKARGRQRPPLRIVNASKSSLLKIFLFPFPINAFRGGRERRVDGL